MKPPSTRMGKTHDVRIGLDTIAVTINTDDQGRVFEVFAKATDIRTDEG